MGQQQLLLVILVTIIVGIATVVAINIFGTAAEEANRDAVRQDLLSAAAQAQAIWARPQMMGGAGGDFSILTEEELLERVNIPRGPESTDGSTVNDNGTYTLTRDNLSVTITGEPVSGTDNIVMTVTREDPEAAGADGGVWRITWPTD